MLKIALKESELGVPVKNVLASEKYLSIKSDNYGWFVDENFYMPFFFSKKLIFKWMVITYPPITLTMDMSSESEKAFLDSICLYLKAHRNVCDHITMPQTNVVFNFETTYGENIPWGSYIVDLCKTDDELMLSFHSKHRNVIKKAMKDGVTVNLNADPKDVYQCIKETLIRQHVHYPEFSYYTALIEKIPNNVGFFTSNYNNEVEGCALVIFDNEHAYYMYGGSIAKPHTGSVNLLQYELMKFLRDKGVKEYDMVGARLVYESGSKYEGIQRFKSRFASGLKRGYTFRFVVSPFKFWLFNKAVSLYCKLNKIEYKDTIDETKRLMKDKNNENIISE